MKIKIQLLCILGAAQVASQTTVTISISTEPVIIRKHTYGHFSEHLGRCIYDGLYVGEESKIPNKDGVRTDIIKALQELKIPNLRWPGGCFADTYHWKDGVGPKDKRPTMVNRWWGGVTEDNSLGTHDFLNLCETLGAEPYLAANVGSSTVKEFTEYCFTMYPDSMLRWTLWPKTNYLYKKRMGVWYSLYIFCEWLRATKSNSTIQHIAFSPSVREIHALMASPDCT